MSLLRLLGDWSTKWLVELVMWCTKSYGYAISRWSNPERLYINFCLLLLRRRKGPSYDTINHESADGFLFDVLSPAIIARDAAAALLHHVFSAELVAAAHRGYTSCGCGELRQSSLCRLSDWKG